MVKSDGPLSIGLVFDDSLDSSDGVAQYVKTLGSWLAEQGHQVSFLVGETKIKQWDGQPVYSLSRNFRVVFNGNRLSIPLPANAKPIKSLLDSRGFDVLHVMMPHSPFMAQKIVDMADERTAVVGTFHIYPSGWLVRVGARLLRAWYGRKIRRFDEIVSVSPAAADFASSVFRFKSEIIPNPVDIRRFQAKKPFKQADKIVFLGRLVPRKGSSRLIQAFSQMKNRSATLVIAGDGPQRVALQRQAIRLGVQDRVEFLGYIEEKNKPSLLAGAKIACFPSLYGESFGIVLIEAMAAGSGVVLGGDNPGYRSVLAEQPSLLVDPNDTEKFAARLDTLLADKTRADELHSWQVKTVKQYDIGQVGPQIVELYRRQIAKRAKKSNN